MVLIIRNDLKMGKGKVAAQCAHGAVAAYKAALKHPKLLSAWEKEGQKKITLKVFFFLLCFLIILKRLIDGSKAFRIDAIVSLNLFTKQVDSDAALKDLAKQARGAGLLTNIVQDAGRTQIAAGSRTVCAIGPGPSSVIDEVTGHLKLF